VLRRAGDGRYDIGLDELSHAIGNADAEAVRSILGHLARAAVIQPAPSPPDRALGRVTGEWDGRARAICRTSATEGTRARWRQYRSVWGWVEGDGCRRAGILRHFGDSTPPHTDPGVPCCDVCDPSLRPPPPQPTARSAAKRARRLSARPLDADALDDAILSVVETAEPAVGRTRTVEILRGGRSKVIVKHAYDGLPEYGTYGHLSAPDVLDRVDALMKAGTLRSTGGRFPKLECV
jgi:ATP-dependent DNA helicase RecQ